MKPFVEKLKAMGACSEAVYWAEKQASWPKLWATCRRGDWMLWLLGKTAGPVHSESRRRLVLAALDCAETALVHIEDPNLAARVKDGTSKLRRYAQSEAAADAAANAELNEAREILSDADAADAAAYAADAAYAAAAAAADRSKALATCADIVRKRYPEAPVLP